MQLMFSRRHVEIWHDLLDDVFYVYGVHGEFGDPRVCPSEAMAREVAAGALL